MTNYSILTSRGGGGPLALGQIREGGKRGIPAFVAQITSRGGGGGGEGYPRFRCPNYEPWGGGGGGGGGNPLRWAKYA